MASDLVKAVSGVRFSRFFGVPDNHSSGVGCRFTTWESVFGLYLSVLACCLVVLGLGWYQKVMGRYVGCGVSSCMFSVRGGFLVVGIWDVEYSSWMDGLVLNTGCLLTSVFSCDTKTSVCCSVTKIIFAKVVGEVKAVFVSEWLFVDQSCVVGGGLVFGCSECAIVLDW